MISRRQFLGGTGATVLGVAMVSRTGAVSLPEVPLQTKLVMQPPLASPNDRSYSLVVTLNGRTLPWRMRGGWKEFHLVVGPIEREFAPGMVGHLWDYNGRSPGPAIECMGGDHVYISVADKLSEHTTAYWHGMILPASMDSVDGLSQPRILTGKTSVYGFGMKRSGTFVYHLHPDEMVQMAIDIIGLIVVHPRDPTQRRVDHDFVFLLAAYDIDPGSYTPRVAEMANLSMRMWSSRVFPSIDPLPVRLDDRMCIRMGSLTMTNHPTYLCGHTFGVTDTDGGWVQPSARWPEVTTGIAVSQIRTIEFIADNFGNWALHYYKSHHAMSAMGHDVPTMIGVQQKDFVEKMNTLVPDYMGMGQAGMTGMDEMEMSLSDNTPPMMTGRGPFDTIEMGSMPTVTKVRRDLPRNSYADPGWYKCPKSIVAYEYTGSNIDG